ncbi:MAG: tyrosine-type recombinase/integrase [Oscillospiraceae bacterium]|jgi:integrase|nr:tyrosine-type recombinase/integrase [Oscillospiraceae bacterium]
MKRNNPPHTKTISPEAPGGFAEHLRRAEKSAETVSKYARYARAFASFAGGAPVTKELAVEWKSGVSEKYSAAGANGMIAAVNSFLRYLGLGELRVSSLKVQRRAFLPGDRELLRAETERLIQTAEREGKPGLALAIRVMLATGARVSELKYITVEAARNGGVEIRLKGKTRELFLQPKLCLRLLRYAAGRGITSGRIFLTRSGAPVDRHTIWREMKALCAKAGVAAEKVFPHNLRKLFARTFFSRFPNLAALADVLGHSDVNTTRIYTAETAETHRRRLAALPLPL